MYVMPIFLLIKKTKMFKSIKTGVLAIVLIGTAIIAKAQKAFEAEVQQSL